MEVSVRCVGWGSRLSLRGGDGKCGLTMVREGVGGTWGRLKLDDCAGWSGKSKKREVRGGCVDWNITFIVVVDGCGERDSLRCRMRFFHGF